MARPLKCPVCTQYGAKEDMIQEENKKYYHLEYCHEKWLKNKEETKVENQQWDDLYQYIIKLHDIIVLPKGNITRLKDLRAGFEFKDGKRVRKWKTGADFGLMLEAYYLAEDSIRWCIAHTLKGSNDTRAINYGVSIMIDKLNEAFARRKNKERQQEYTIINNKDNDVEKEVEEVKYKPKDTPTNNISDFL